MINLFRAAILPPFGKSLLMFLFFYSCKRAEASLKFSSRNYDVQVSGA